MRPGVEFLGTELVERIVAEARDLLRTLGVEINNPEILSLLADHGAEVDISTKRARLTDGIIDTAVETAPSGLSGTPRSGHSWSISPPRARRSSRAMSIPTSPTATGSS
jgi:trimethylamine:corrinoid methyltransferase-like protein